MNLFLGLCSIIFPLCAHLNYSTHFIQIYLYFLHTSIVIDVFIEFILISIYFFLYNSIISQNSDSVIVGVLHSNIGLLGGSEHDHYNNSFFQTVGSDIVRPINFNIVDFIQSNLWYWDILDLFSAVFEVWVLNLNAFIYFLQGASSKLNFWHPTNVEHFNSVGIVFFVHLIQSSSFIIPIFIIEIQDLFLLDCEKFVCEFGYFMSNWLLASLNIDGVGGYCICWFDLYEDILCVIFYLVSFEDVLEITHVLSWRRFHLFL